MNISEFLKRKKYIDASEDDCYIFDSWAKSHPDYVIHYVTHNKSEIFTINESNNKKYHIIWDVSFWELFTKFMFIIDESNFSPILDVNILKENNGYLLSLFFHYLSERYNFYQELSENLDKKAKDFGYQILIDNFYGNEKENNMFSTTLCKQFVFWHEIAHIEFHKFNADSLLQIYINMIYSILDDFSENISDQELEPQYIKIKLKIKTRTVAQNLIEELAADLRAIQRIMQYDYISNNKDNLYNLLSSIVSLINFSMIKSIIDRRWDYYVFKKEGKSPTLIEHQMIRKILFPYLVFIKYGVKELGNAFMYDINKQQKNTELFYKVLDITMDEWYIRSLLGEQCCVITSQILEQIYILNTVNKHMSNISVDISSKRLKYLFNIAYTVQQRDDPIKAIPLYFKYIEMAKKKNDENCRFIGDAYSRIARIYATNGQHARAEILLNNALDIANKISKEDICFAFFYNNIGNVFLSLDNVKMAIKYYLKSLKLRIAYNDLFSIEMAAVYNNLGNCFFTQQKYPQALKYFLKAYQIINVRYDKNNIQVDFIKDRLNLFTNLTSEFTNTFRIQNIIFLYEINKDTPLHKELHNKLRDLLTMDFDCWCESYIEIAELIETAFNENILFAFFWYNYNNIQNVLKNELKKNT